MKRHALFLFTCVNSFLFNWIKPVNSLLLYGCEIKHISTGLVTLAHCIIPTIKSLIYRATRGNNTLLITIHIVYNVEIILCTWWRHVSWCIEQKRCSEKYTKCFLETTECVRHDFRRVGSHIWEWLLNAVCGQLTLRDTPVNAVSANQRRAK